MNNNVFENSILIIGGMAIGKSTVSKLLSEKMNMPLISTDAWKDEFLKGVSGYSFEKQLQIRKEKGFYDEVDYLIPYLNMSLNNILDNLKVPSIIDVGALDTMVLKEPLTNKLKKFHNIVLLASSNIDDILKRRKISDNPQLKEIYSKTLSNSNNEFLCTQTIIVDGKTPDEIANEIITLK